MDDRHEALPEAVDLSHNCLGLNSLSIGREVANIDEHDGDLDLFARKGGTRAQQVLGDLRIDVGAEGLPNPLALGQSSAHVVEARLK